MTEKYPEQTPSVGKDGKWLVIQVDREDHSLPWDAEVAAFKKLEDAKTYAKMKADEDSDCAFVVAQAKHIACLDTVSMKEVG